MYPVALITYNRAFHTYKTLEALSKNPEAKDTDLYVFSDGPKGSQDEEEIESTLKVIQKFKRSFHNVIISKSDKNNGTAKNIRNALRSIFFDHEINACIILEDDILISTDFLFFMNTALEKFKKNKKMQNILY